VPASTFRRRGKKGKERGRIVRRTIIRGRTGRGEDYASSSDSYSSYVHRRFPLSNATTTVTTNYHHK
jgi:hypothetical protein